MEMAEGKIRPLLGGVEVHIDLGEDRVVLLQNLPLADHFAHAVMRPGEKIEQRLLALAITRAAGKDDVIVEIGSDQRLVVTRVEECDIVVESLRNFEKFNK